MMKRNDEHYMQLSIEQAQKAADLGEVPVGAVIVKDHAVIATGYNRREMDKSALAHAEIIAIAEACKALGSWRLSDCTLYVTLEPCPMCAGAIINARIERVVYGAGDPQAGALGSLIDLSKVAALNSAPKLTVGVLAEQCSGLLTDFFNRLR